MGWIGCIRFEKLQQQFVSQNMTLGSKGWIGCVRCEKFRHDYVAHTFALIAPVHPVLHRVWCSYETIPSAPKHYATHQNMSLGSKGADWVCSLHKIPIWLHGTDFCINCTSSPRSAPSLMQLWNDPKCTQTLCNAPKHEFRVQWGWIGCVRWEKFGRDFVARAFALITVIHHVLHRVSCSYETIWNAPKYCATHQNMSLRSNVADWVRSLRKIPAWLRGTSFRINCTSSPFLHRVSCGYETIPNAPKHYATHQQMSLGSNGVDSARWLQKNPYVTSWHELLH